MKEIANFLYELGMLGRLRRQGPYLAGIKDPETIAQHSHRASIIAYILAKMENVNVEKTVLMTMFHDVPETRMTDLNKVTRRYFKVKEPEEIIIKEQTQNLPENIKQSIRSLLDEFNEKESKEAVVARDADYLECAIQAKEYMEQGTRAMADWIKNCEKGVRTNSAKKLISKIKDTNTIEWWDNLKQLMFEETENER